MDQLKNKNSDSSLFIQVVYECCLAIEDKVSNSQSLSITSIVELLNKCYQIAAGAEGHNACKLYFDTRAWEGLNEKLDGLFLPPYIKLELEKVIERAIKARNDFWLEIEDKGPFSTEKSIKNYLKAYYELIRRLRIYNSELQLDLNRYKSFLSDVLNVDIFFENDDYGDAFYSPASIDGILQVYYALYDYSIVVGKVTSEAARANYRQILISRILRRFRWKVVYDNQLYHVAVPPYKSTYNVLLPIRKMDSYISYEGIGELRLLDKILFELDRIRKECNNKGIKMTPVTIRMIGDIHLKPIRRMAEELNYILAVDESHKIDTTVNLTVISNQEFCDFSIGEKIYVSYIEYARYYSVDNDFSYKALLQDIDTSHVTMLLDICELYNRDYDIMPVQGESELQILNTNPSYLDSFDSAMQKGLSKDSTFMRRLRQAYCALYPGNIGKLGIFKRRINVPLINYLIERYSDKEERTGDRPAVYIFVSDADGFSKAFFSSEYFLRVEHYNEKNIALMRISSEKELELSLDGNRLSDGRKILSFSIWQLAKHVCLRDLDSLREILFDNKFEKAHLVYLLRQLRVGIQYDEWPKEVVLSYCVERHNNETVEEKELLDVAEKKLANYVKDVIVPFFEDFESDTYLKYFKHITSSFLYSNVKNVEDMLILHIFTDQHHRLGRIRMKINPDASLRETHSSNCKYSEKRYYEFVIHDYDTTAEEFKQKYDKILLMEKVDKQLKKRILRNVAEACERLQYSDSILHYRCGKELG